MDRDIEFLNAPTAAERLENLKTLLSEEKGKPEVLPQFANNHIHTTFSFSPYSPTAAVWAARRAGLPTAGIMDHDSISGAAEFREAAKLAGIGSTCGIEMRVDFSESPFFDRRLNNPDQSGVAYMTFHSIKARYFDKVREFLKPHVELRNERNRKELDNINRALGLKLDFDRDIVPISQYANGGSITERHLFYAAAKAVIPEGSEAEQYKLLGKYKSGLNKEIFIPAKEELITLREAIDFASEIDAYLCYAYLGDVGASPTGDKAAAKYEDDYLEELVEYLSDAGIKAITYMPSRNTIEQMDRLMKLCDKYGMKQISGEDINQPSQSFICKELEDPRFSHLVDAAWELVKREEEG